VNHEIARHYSHDTPHQDCALCSRDTEIERLQEKIIELRKYIPDGHDDWCVNDHLNDEPENVVFTKCGRCRAREL